MEFTGERVIPELMDATNGLLLEHLGRYHFAATYARGRVLDIACGVGYGCYMLAKYCKSDVSAIVGIDEDQETINYARQKYAHPKCEYYCDNALDPGLVSKYGQFDTIFSFETLEHLDDDKVFVANLESMLPTGGRLVLSTPFGAGRAFPSSQPFHQFQLTEVEFRDLFKNFSDVQFFHQKGLVFRPYPCEETGGLGIAVAVK